MQPKITIIIPTLNVADYIKECLDSVINQTLHELEILIIDANSTDGTYEILKEYAAKDKRIQILEDNKKSTGYAKNLGIERANAPYIAIVESDDYIEPEMMEKLYQKAEQTGADIVKAGFDTFVGNGRKRFVFPKTVPQHNDDYEKVLMPRNHLSCFRWIMFEWLGLYRKDFLDNYSIRHNESSGAAYQDIGFWFLSFSYAKAVYLMKNIFYHYRCDNPNASVKSKDKVFQTCNEYMYIQKKLQYNPELWKQVESAFYREFFRSNMVVYERLSSELKSLLSDRMYKILTQAMRDGSMDKALFEEEKKNLDMLLSSPRVFDKYCDDRWKNKNKQLSIVKNKCKNFPFIVIFGAGSYGANLHYALYKENVQVAAYADNHSEKWDKMQNGLVIYSVEKCELNFPGCLYLIANKNYGKEIIQGLWNKGIPEERTEECDVLALIENLI